ncbi:MarR family transcriptional regulator [Actinomadura sp. ATCC 31491]|uniref:MarR family transcriptional regulator n=2 Tax=Actinomadura luzonensis TaxID=2805427 RepID=A0ABT0FQ66_9ACTN|nr:MarR family transcriptional regulator [Actinomadura luzonensis]
MTNSFADELIGKLYTSLAASDVTSGGVQLLGMNEETRDAVTVCLERRKLVAVAGDEQRLLASDELLQATYAVARHLNQFRAADLASELAISLPNANNRLKRLLEAGALCRQPDPERERGGKQFTYQLPFGASTTRGDVLTGPLWSRFPGSGL